MKTITMYGASDDLVEINGGAWYDGGWTAGDEEYGAFDGLDMFALDEADVPRLRVSAIYSRSGCWGFAVGLLDEERPWPDGWEATIRQSKGHSTVLVLSGPDLKGIITEDTWEERQENIDSWVL